MKIVQDGWANVEGLPEDWIKGGQPPSPGTRASTASKSNRHRLTCSGDGPVYLYPTPEGGIQAEFDFPLGSADIVMAPDGEIVCGASFNRVGDYWIRWATAMDTPAAAQMMAAWAQTVLSVSTDQPAAAPSWARKAGA